MVFFLSANKMGFNVGYRSYLYCTVVHRSRYRQAYSTPITEELWWVTSRNARSVVT